jgi:uncharacterized damage-inducible protein DinB
MDPQQAQGLAQFLLEGLKQEFETTSRVLAALPEDQLQYQLGEKGRTAQQLMWHIVKSELWFGEGIVNLNFGPEEEGNPPSSVKDIVEQYRKEIPAMMERVRGMSGEQLATPVEFFGMFNLPVVVYLNFWMVHTVHHRGQLSTYLRSLNAHVPAIYGPSADEGLDAVSGAQA